MPQRSEPQILADLIRLHDKIERGAAEFRAAASLDSGSTRTRSDAWLSEQAEHAELIEQARAALHRYVVARGKVHLTMPRAPLNLWTGVVQGIGALSMGIPLLTDTPLHFGLIAGLLITTGLSLTIDRKHL